MKELHIEEGISALFFFISIVILVRGPTGLLTVPGVIAGVLGIFFVMKKKHAYATVLGVIASATSFTGQGIIAFCIYCSASATMFALAGLISLACKIRENITWSIMILPIMGSLLFLAIKTAPIDVRTNEVIITDQYQVQVLQNQDLKPELFISVSCKSCEEAMKEYVSRDPKGEYWQPVIVPNAEYARGKQLLQSLGYAGSIFCASQSPSSMLPCLKTNTRVFSGAKGVISQIDHIVTKGDSH